jgi:diaminopimelate epimerase
MARLHSFPCVKTQAFGNDFLLIEQGVAASIADIPAFARRVCDRHRGLGADGLVLVDPTPAGADTRLWNSDGSRAEVSGNGVRCAAAWTVHQRGTAVGETVVIGTAAGPKRLTLLSKDEARFTFRAEMGPPTDLRHEVIDVGGTLVGCVVLRVGNPQCVVLGPATPERLRAIGAVLAVHPFFPEGTNVELVEPVAPDHLRILIWERGVGPTESSGTGACAAAVSAAFAGVAARDVRVESPGGTQRVEWTPETVWLTGWAEIVATAEWWVKD